VCCSVVSCNILSQGKICDFVNFYLTCTGFASVEPAQASQPYCSVRPAEPTMVTMSSSDTEESLELLLQVPIMVYHLDLWGLTPKNLCQALMLVVTSLRIGPKPKIWSWAFMIWSQALIANNPRNKQKSCARGSSSQRPRSQATMLWRSRRQKPEGGEAPRRKSKRTKKSIIEDNTTGLRCATVSFR
jgi:hypothetical protein